MSDLPTKSGPYYWREKDGDAWTVVYLTKAENFVTFGVSDRIRLESMKGEWLPIPTAEELVELKEPRPRWWMMGTN